MKALEKELSAGTSVNEPCPYTKETIGFLLGREQEGLYLHSSLSDYLFL